MQNIVNEINAVVSEHNLFEFSVLSYKKGTLAIAGSSDFMYYHNFEIIFENVFSFIGNLDWIADTEGIVLEILENSNEAFEINKKYCVEQGNTIFKFYSEDNIINYVMAEKILFKNEMVKYS